MPDSESAQTRRIKEVIARRSATLFSQLQRTSLITQLPLALREAIVEELIGEFTERGLREDGEPNPYGLEVEEMIDACDLTGVRSSRRKLR